MNKLRWSIFVYSNLILIITLRFIYVQIIYQDKYAYMSFQNITLRREIIAPRGNIYDKNGTLLSGNQNIFNLLIHTLNKQKYNNALDIISTKIINYKRNQRNFSHIVKKRLSWEELKYIESVDKNCFFIQHEYHRDYYNESCSNLLGYTKYADAQHIGVSGIEKTNNQNLTGKSGKQQVQLNAYGEILDKTTVKNPIKGNDINLSLELDLQNKAYEYLSQIKKGCVCILDLKNNSIAASVSYPSYDSNKIRENWEELTLNPYKPLIHRVFEGVYPIGSTMKIFVALFALEEGIINEHTLIECTGEFFIGSHRFKCWKTHGVNVNLERGITESCDVFFYSLCRSICPVKFQNFLYKLGLKEDQNIFPTNTKGFVADPNYVRKKFRRKWKIADTLLISIGQGMFFCTPFELSTMMARLVSMKKHTFTFNTLKEQNENLNFKKHNIMLLQKYMKQVTHFKNGTAFYHWTLNKNPNISGKTGTVQTRALKKEEYGLHSSKKEYERREHTIFCGYLPTENPRYVITVIAENSNNAKNIAFQLCNYIQKR